MGKKSRSKKEAAAAAGDSTPSTSGQSTARSDKNTQQMGNLSLDDKPKPQQKQGSAPKSDQPNTGGQAQKQQSVQGVQKQSQGAAPGQGQQQQQPRPAQGAQQLPQGAARGQGQQQQPRPAQGAQQPSQGAARGQGQQQQPRPAQGAQQPSQGAARGQGQQQQRPEPPSSCGQNQQRQPHGGQQQSQGSARGQGQQQRPEGGQQPAPATIWTQKPSQAAGGQEQQQKPPAQRPAQVQRPAQAQRPGQQGKGDERPYTAKPAIIPYDYSICPYKGPGTRGKKVVIETNYLKLDVSKLASHAFHYDITIDFEPPGRSQPGKKFMHPAFAAFVKANFANASLAYDGQKNAYAPQKLDLSIDYQRVVNIVDDETKQSRSFKVEIKEVRGSFIDLSILKDYRNAASIEIPMRAIQCLDIVLKSAFQNRAFTGKLVGRSFYMRPSRPVDLGDFYELWIGMFQSTILGSIPYVNVDIAHKAFPSSISIIEIIKNSSSYRGDVVNLNKPLDSAIINNVTTHLKGLDIGYNMPGGTGVKAYKFSRLTEPATKLKFSIDNKETTVEQYFASRNFQLKYPNLPCISTANKSFFPVELCHVIGGQAVQKKTTENQTRVMIREAATSTDVRKNKILNILNQIKYNDASSVRGFGLKVDDKFAEIPARILEPPMLQYKDRTIRPQRGEWRPENMHFITPKEAVQWGVLILDNRVRESDVDGVCRMILRISATNGMAFSTGYFIDVFNNRADDRQLDRKLDDIKAKKCQVLFCVIPDRGDSYARVKQSAELRCGVLTQCIKAFTITRKGQDASTISNILLKVNAKLNGFNHKLHSSPILNQRRCMVIGADVTHPSPDQSKIPSVVGVAASHDRDAFKYNICWRLQDPRQEMIQDFKAIILEQLDYYALQNNKQLPERILYFRDGVSEGQFTEIQNVELKALQEACKMKYGLDFEKRVKITMVVVQKRHHTRFFPGKSNCGTSDRKNNNVPPGTIVDQQITPPKENHFYLVSHQSIQGVAKPTKYCILHDEGNTLPIDELQALTYDLCHLFTRCNRSVSYPAPTYYAHLAAYRGRVYIEGRNDLNMDNLQNEWRQRQIKDDIVKGHPMYFV